MTEVRARFAPSPTGYLHLGGARTALYNFIFARRNNGAFVLRIEDTDPSRSTDQAIAQILSSMREMGLDWDEGPEKPGPHGPYRQTERTDIYRQYVQRLFDKGHLYSCFCTPEELESERRAAQAEKRDWVYSGKCRDLTVQEAERRKAAGEPWTLRFRVPSGRTVFDDMLRDPVEFENETIGDFIVQRSDGTFTYNLAVVVDDVTMLITHVIRGDDHLSNTPKQILIYRALDETVPHFLHIPLLFGTDRKKLSKRHGATQLEQLVLMGHLVEVVRNYLCFLSTEFTDEMIFWTLDDLVRGFDVERLGTSPSIFDPGKLRWMNGRFIRELPPEELGERLVGYLSRTGFYRDPGAALPGAAGGPAPEAAPQPAEPTAEQAALTQAVAPLVQEKMDLFSDFGAVAGWFFRPLELSQDAQERLAATDGAAAALQAAAEGLGRLQPFDAAHIEEFVRGLPAALDMKPKGVFAALRLGMSGQSVTPGLFESIEVLGQSEAAARLAKAAATLP